MSNNRTIAQHRAAVDAAARKSRIRRSRTLGIWGIVFVVVVVLCLVAVSSFGSVNTSAKGASSPAIGTPIPSALVERLQSVPLSVLASAPTAGLDVSPAGIKDQKLTSDGKPDLLYIGAEFCPVCATERWAMYVALSKFGTFSPQPGRSTPHSRMAISRR